MDVSNVTSVQAKLPATTVQREAPKLHSVDMAVPSPEEQLRRLQVATEQIRSKGADGTNLDIAYDKQTSTYVMTVTDQAGQVVRQIPAEQIRNAMAYLTQMAGAMFDKSA